MTNIYLGLAVIGTVSLAMFLLARRLTRSARWWQCDLLAALTLIVMMGYIFWLWDTVLLAKLLPFSNLIIVGNWFPPLTSFLAGVAWSRVPGRMWRKSWAVFLLAATGTYAALFPVVGAPPKCENTWTHDGICLQTTKQTCSPASAATILRAHGISATEEEMAQLCLTRHGTKWQGLYHGLKAKTAGTDWDVEVFECSFAELRRLGPGPMILTVGLDDTGEVDPLYTVEHGWIPGMLHSVVFFGFRDEGYAEMGDPTLGREPWTPDDFEFLWQGRGMRLVRREFR